MQHPIVLSPREAKLVANKLLRYVQLIQGMDVPFEREDVEFLLEEECMETMGLLEKVQA